MKEINYTYSSRNVNIKLNQIKPYINNFGFDGAVLWILVTDKNYKKVMYILGE